METIETVGHVCTYIPKAAASLVTHTIDTFNSSRTSHQLTAFHIEVHQCKGQSNFITYTHKTTNALSMLHTYLCKGTLSFNGTAFDTIAP